MLLTTNQYGHDSIQLPILILGTLITEYLQENLCIVYTKQWRDFPTLVIPNFISFNKVQPSISL